MSWCASSRHSEELLSAHAPDSVEADLPSTKQRRTPSVKVVRHKPTTGDELTGRVLEGTGRWWLVELEATRALAECSIAGTVVAEHSDATLIAVGDRVRCVLTRTQSPGGLPQGLIVAILPRTTKLERYRRRERHPHVIASNVDQLVILQAAAEPAYDRFLIDRYLIAAYRGGLTPVLCINKIDLGSAADIRQELGYYAEALGVELVLCSAVTGDGIETLRSVLANHVSVLSGPSGVGKSTLTNVLLGTEVQEVGSISPKLGQGRHVTTMARMFRLPDGGYIVDTPGIRDLTIWELTREELPDYFPDFAPWAEQCRYQPCSHIHEPNCAVRDAVHRGDIPEWRYDHYHRLWHSLPKYEYQWRQLR